MFKLFQFWLMINGLVLDRVIDQQLKEVIFSNNTYKTAEETVFNNDVNL